ncbi:MAG: DUF2946 family protein [Thermomonas sp.]
MLRYRLFRHSMARLALVAMLLLATLPTIGRLAGSNPGMQRAMTAICTVQGMKFIDLGTRSDLASPANATPDRMPHPDMDCDYCPILAATLAAFAIVYLLPALFRHADPPQGRNATSGRCFLHPCGLGSRGPPFAR